MRKTLIIYISGGITGIAPETVAENFAIGEQEAVERFATIGNVLEVINPLSLDDGIEKAWDEYMRVDITAMMRCNAIYMLRGWQYSRGARLENHIAKALGFVVLSQALHLINESQ